MQWHIIELESTDSTNDEAKRIAEKHDGLIAVRTNSQTAGRGQYGRQWTSPPGKNLLVTYSIPLTMVATPSLLSLNAGVVVHSIIREYGLPVYCKWPNDLIVSGNKIAGILIERDADRCYVGIGLNGNWPETKVTTEDGKGITGIKNETGKKIDIRLLCKDIRTRLLECITLSADKILARYRPVWNDAGKQVKVMKADTWYPGTIHDINMDGTLTVITEMNTEIVVVSSTQITMETE